MKEKLFVVYGTEKDYIYRFSDYLQKKVKLPLRVRSFTDEEELEHFLEETGADILLLPPELKARGWEGTAGTFFWSETPAPEESREVYRYRPMNRIVRQLLQCYEETLLQERQESGLKARIWGVYSPVHGSGQTAAAVILGQILAERDSVLYINLERFSGFSQLFKTPEKGDLSDLLYFYKVQEHSIARLPEITGRLGNMCYLAPAGCREDLRNTSPEDWEGLIDAIAGAGLYRHLIIDVGDGVLQENRILAKCSRILMPVREDAVAAAKETEWREYMEREDPELLDMVRRVILPPVPGMNGFMDYRQLRCGEWGRILQQVVRDDTMQGIQQPVI